MSRSQKHGFRGGGGWRDTSPALKAHAKWNVLPAHGHGVVRRSLWRPCAGTPKPMNKICKRTYGIIIPVREGDARKPPAPPPLFLSQCCKFLLQFFAKRVSAPLPARMQAGLVLGHGPLVLGGGAPSHGVTWGVVRGTKLSLITITAISAETRLFHFFSPKLFGRGETGCRTQPRLTPPQRKPGGIDKPAVFHSMRMTQTYKATNYCLNEKGLRLITGTPRSFRY